MVRRWGWRVIGLAVTGIGLYLVAPGLLTMFGAWPQLADVAVRWFAVLAVLEICSFATLWWLVRIALAPAPGPAPTADGQVAIVPPLGWGTTATAQLAGNAASKVVPGGAATGGVIQARILISAGQPAATVASGLTGVSLLGTAVLLLLPVLTIPALVIGPPPARQLQLGLVVSVILAAAIVAIGVTALTRPRVVAVVGRGIGRTVHLARASVTTESFACSLLAARDRIAAAFQAHWWRATFAAAANRMFDYAALVAAWWRSGRTSARRRSCWPTSSRRRSPSSRSRPAASGSSTPA